VKIDPFLIKRLPKWHFKRLLYTASARMAESYSRFYFDEFEIPFVDCIGKPAEVPEASWEDTQVTPQQASYLLKALEMADNSGQCIVEVGSWRGVTTEYLAKATNAPLVAIDPFIGPRNEVNLRRFTDRIAQLSNVTLRRQTFGEAVRSWSAGPARFVFIDAAHDYFNVRHDLSAAIGITRPGSIVAMHDVDDRNCAGCRRALYEQLERFELITHIANLAILRRLP
jgi:predicted O-methyltransferase YrrM